MNRRPPGIRSSLSPENTKRIGIEHAERDAAQRELARRTRRNITVGTAGALGVAGVAGAGIAAKNSSKRDKAAKISSEAK